MSEPRTFPVAGAILTALAMAGLTAAGGEAAAALRDGSARWAAYAGGAGALVAGLSGLPFLIKLARLGADKDGKFWNWWGLGILTRTGVGLVAAMVVLKAFPENGELGVVVLAAVHMAALMIETVWVAVRLSRTETGK